MRRILTTCFILGLPAGILFSTTPAEATASCTVTHQFTYTFASDDGTNWILGVTADQGNGFNIYCGEPWRIAFKAQYKAGGTWHLGVTNTLEFPNYNTNLHYATNQFVQFYTAPETPTGFTGYWDNGDGLLSPRLICHYPWRIHEAVFGVGQSDLADYYTPPSPVTC